MLEICIVQCLTEISGLKNNQLALVIDHVELQTAG